MIVIPADTKPDYIELRSRLLLDFNKSKLVDDMEEVRHLIWQQSVLDP